MKILIINSVPLNGGDEALLEATTSALQQVFDSVEITVLCKDYQKCKALLPQYQFYPDYEHTLLDFEQTFFSRIKFFLKRVCYKLKLRSFIENQDLLRSDGQKKVLQLFQNSDLIISAPGGYLHDYYSYFKRMQTFELIFSFKKPLVLLAQSIGPFWKNLYIERLKHSFNQMLFISLRESISANHLKRLDLRNENIYTATDNAFLLLKELQEPPQKVTNHQNLNIALAFRKWQGVENTKKIVQKATQLIRHLIDKHPNIKFTFLSTCQGVEGYVDDSFIATEIVSNLATQDQQYCSIDTNRYAPMQLIDAYQQFDGYIGMRLHGAILSMLAHTPAFNIGYELKTEGIYKNLSLSEYQISYEKTLDEWLERIAFFIKDINLIRSKLPKLLEHQYQIAFNQMSDLKTIYESYTNQEKG